MEYILGVIVSIVVELVKKYLGTDTLGTYIALLILALIAAGGYYALVQLGSWESVAMILVTAGSFHNFIIRRVIKKPT